MLQLLNRGREYIQLHRDTTVQQLTVQPTVHGGRIEFEDSPLVKAVQEGSVLVIDEIDKAPTHVTCVLKTLLETGEMSLSDGRTIVPSDSPAPDGPTIIHTHPAFSVICLANRPGYPFLGNDFFGAVGDVFACFSVDNPSPSAQVAMLKVCCRSSLFGLIMTSLAPHYSGHTKEPTLR